MHAIAVRRTPDAATGTGRRHFAVCITAGVEEVLRPHINRTGINVAAVIEIDRGERIVFSQHIGDAVGLSGTHDVESSGIIAPRAGILCAGMSFRLHRHERRLLPTAIL